MKKVLPKQFYERDTHIVAAELLGKILVRGVGDKKITGRITEVEAYVGEDDLACHASKGRTLRTEVMFGEAGRAYVYLIYGMYHCLNVVTDQKAFPAAVLIRALEPIEGIDLMKNYRSTEQLTRLTTGPGKLCDALAITKKQNGVPLSRSAGIHIEDDDFTVRKNDIVTSPRIGVDYAKHCAQYPWRYYLKDSKFLSRT
ncbi:MAG: DNA-3-methyladenine glycosylase [Candidatus Andersenbacteria bacterium]